MPVVEVMVDETHRVFALLDTGSSTSFCSQRLVRSLGISGRQGSMRLKTMNKCSMKDYEVVSLTLSSSDGESLSMSEVYVVDQIPVQCAPLDISKCAHFSDIRVPSACGVDEVDILIGQDNAEALVPLEIR